MLFNLNFDQNYVKMDIVKLVFKMENIKKQIDELLSKKDFIIVAIDGKCASGKTTLANELAKYYDCNVFHMDDFFLRPEQRINERFSEVGGNIDYERFNEEVLIPLKAQKDFSYQPFDCSTQTLSNEIQVSLKKLNIIEGTYSQHLYFGEPYDLKILLDINPDLQRKRILERPEFLHKRFFEEWIPMENEYFKKYFGI